MIILSRNSIFVFLFNYSSDFYVCFRWIHSVSAGGSKGDTYPQSFTSWVASCNFHRMTVCGRLMSLFLKMLKNYCCCFSSDDLCHSALLSQLFPSQSLPLPDSDRCFKTITGRWDICWGSEEKEAHPLQRWPQQRSHRAHQWEGRPLHAWPLDNLSGNAVALQVLPVHSNVRRNLVPLWGGVVPGGSGSWRPAGWENQRFKMVVEIQSMTSHFLTFSPQDPHVPLRKVSISHINVKFVPKHWRELF